MSRYEESSKHSGIGHSSTGDSPEKPEDEAIEIDSENEIDVEGDLENDGEESEGEDEKSSVGDYVAEPRVNGNTSMRHLIERYCKFYQGNKSKKQNILRALYDEYAPNVEGGKYMKKLENLQSQPSSTSSNVSMTEDDLIDEWMHFVEDSDDKVVGDEMDSYLFDPLVQITKEESTKHFNILLWWKVNGNKYHILAVIAKDIFAIQVSTVASESAFSTDGRVMSDFRSSLTPKLVEALICLQNWLRGDNIITLEDDAPS